MNQPQFIHFLNGPLQRQSLQLPEGDLVCGTSPEADIIISLNDDVPQFVLTCNGNAVYRADDLPCQIEGQLSSERLIPEGAPVEIAGCRFFVSDMASPVWPSDRAPAKENGKVRGYRRIALGAGVGLTLIAALILLFYGLLKPQPTQINPVEQVKLWLNEHRSDFTDLDVIWRPDGKVELKGYYPSYEAIQPLLQRLKYYSVDYHLQAFSEADLHDAVNYLASLSGYTDLQIKRGEKPGSIDISGSIIADNTWRRFLNALQDLEGLESWEVNNLTLMNTQELLTLVKSLKLLGMVSIERHKQVFTITGLLNEDQKKALNNAIEKLAGINSGRILFQNMAPASPSDAVFSTPVISVGGSKTKPFIELSDGSRLQPGAKLNNNYEIVAIDATRGIDLLGDDQLLHYTFNF